ncbi:MAG: iron chaperone [Brevundimonas sp.]|uniref:iron chaperone n=1 Tax=Brevundimonas sp. TaxID=1871086 RepID=UPI00391B82FC
MAAAPEPLRALLTRLRVQLSQALPDAEEVMMYGMPGFRIDGALVAGYAAFSKQCGLYIDPGAIADNAEAISALNLKATKTGVTFSAARPITDALVKTLAVASRHKKGVQGLD